MLGLEYRPTFWVNIYNRLRYLEFSELRTPDVKRMLSKVESEFLETLESEDE